MESRGSWKRLCSRKKHGEDEESQYGQSSKSQQVMRQGLDHIEPRSMLIRLRTLGNYVRVLCVCSVGKLCPTLCNFVDCSPPGFSVHGILQARILERLPVGCPPPGDIPDPGIKPMSPTLAAGFFTTEPPVKPYVRVLKQGFNTQKIPMTTEQKTNQRAERENGNVGRLESKIIAVVPLGIAVEWVNNKKNGQIREIFRRENQGKMVTD